MVVPILVSEVVSTPVERVAGDATLDEVARRLQATAGDAVVVVRDGNPVGIVARTDLVARLAQGPDLTGEVAVDVMSSPIFTVEASTPIQEGAATLYEHDIEQAVVTDGESVVGLLRRADLTPYLPESATTPLETEEREWNYDYTDAATPGISVGDVVRFSKPISELDLELFAEISGDKNPLHLEEAYAERTRFGRRIVHGALVSGVVSAALSKLPGVVIYLSQNVSYSAPVDIGERVTARCEVIADLGRGRYRLAFTVVDEEETEVISGEATVLVEALDEG